MTFTGSVVAFGKLAGKIDGMPKKLPGGHLLNAAALALCLIFGFMYFGGAGIWTMVLVTLIAGFIGWHLIMGIGGADMPVVVSMLNSYSGWAAAAIGFTLGNDLLIVTGALVGSSGAILSYIMCRAMNRHFVAVILGGFGGTGGPAMEVSGEQIAIEAEGVAAALEDAKLDHHRAGLWHGGRAGAAIGKRADRTVFGPREKRCVLRSTPWRAVCPAI